jgi:N-sulfoglucosamine sulfohydrolase
VIDSLVSWTDLTPTILDFAGVAAPAKEFHGRSFRRAIEGKDYKPATEIYASHTFHEITMYYPMRVVRSKEYKLIWNIAHGLEYPFASDLFASSTWQSVIKNNLQYAGKRKVMDFLHRPQFELYNIQKDPDESINLANHPDYAAVKVEMMKKLKTFQQETGDPWVTKWDYE